MSNNSRWPEAWDQLVDRVNQDPNIQAFEEIDSFNGGRGAISSLKNLKTKEKFTCFTSRDSMHSGKMYFVYDDDYTIQVGRSVKGKRRRTETFATVDELIEKFNQSYEGATDDSLNVTEGKNTIKLKSLLEGYAWERKPGKPLPTLDEVQAEYEKKLREDAQNEDFGGSYGGNKNRRWSKPSYSRGEWVDDPNDDKGGSPIKVTAWDTLVDEYNGKEGYSTSTKSDSRVYESEIGNLSVGMEWNVSFRNNNWRYQLYKLGQLANIFRNLDELISHFKDNNGGNNVTESIITEETYRVAGREVTLNKNGGEDQTKWTVTFKQNNKTVPYADVISLIKPRPKMQEPRWQDNDGDGKWYEKGDDVKESISLTESMKRYRTKNI